MATWRELITKEMRERGDSGPLVACTLSNEELDTDFFAGFGGANGKPFTAWTATRVYFPVVYNCAEWVGSVPRNPCDEAAEHFGG